MRLASGLGLIVLLGSAARPGAGAFAGQLARAKKLGVAAGGDIMIHGIRNGYGWIGPLHRLRDWTRGCIAVTDREIEEIWRLVPVGTPVEIRP